MEMRRLMRAVWQNGVCCLLGSLLFYSAAHAGRPMEVDDAGIADPGTCELETWSEHRKHSNGYWFEPACNVAENLEITLGAALERPNSDSNTKAFAAEAKSMLAEGISGNTDVALSVGVEHSRESGDSDNEWEANLPVTSYFADERLAWHNNIGAAYEQDDRHYVFTWGTGAEYELTDKFALYGEVFGDSTERPFGQVSVGYWIKPEQFQITLGVGDKLEGDSEERWVSLGINLESAPFF